MGKNGYFSDYLNAIDAVVLYLGVAFGPRFPLIHLQALATGQVSAIIANANFR